MNYYLIKLKKHPILEGI